MGQGEDKSIKCHVEETDHDGSVVWNDKKLYFDEENLLKLRGQMFPQQEDLSQKRLVLIERLFAELKEECEKVLKDSSAMNWNNGRTRLLDGMYNDYGVVKLVTRTKFKEKLMLIERSLDEYDKQTKGE